MIEFNNQITAELEVTDAGNNKTFKSLGKAFKSVSQSLGENVYTASYLSDEGFSSSEVSGLNFSVAFSGDYLKNDPVIEYIFSPEVLHGLGDARKTKLKITKGTRVVTWNVTMTKIKENGGDANEPNSITLELRGNGKPKITATSAA